MTSFSIVQQQTYLELRENMGPHQVSSKGSAPHHQAQCICLWSLLSLFARQGLPSLRLWWRRGPEVGPQTARRSRLPTRGSPWARPQTATAAATASLGSCLQTLPPFLQHSMPTSIICETSHTIDSYRDSAAALATKDTEISPIAHSYCLPWSCNSRIVVINRRQNASTKRHPGRGFNEQVHPVYVGLYPTRCLTVPNLDAQETWHIERSITRLQIHNTALQERPNTAHAYMFQCFRISFECS